MARLIASSKNALIAGTTLIRGKRCSPCNKAVSSRRAPSQLRVMTTAAAQKEIISTDKAPGAVGPYSQAVKVGQTLYVSGQVGLVPGTKDLAGDDVKSQAEQALKNLTAILEAAGSSLDNVAKTTCFLVTMSDFAAFNEVYGQYFKNDKPSRSCFAVAQLPLGAKVEIEAIAIANEPASKL